MTKKKLIKIIVLIEFVLLIVLIKFTLDYNV